LREYEAPAGPKLGGECGAVCAVQATPATPTENVIGRLIVMRPHEDHHLCVAVFLNIAQTPRLLNSADRYGLNGAIGFI
jgi:hypothetical protein